jgi:N-acetylmuramoyl-L-alanine amidase
MEDTTSQFTLNHLERISRKTDRVDVVIIDPGHGGDDWGNVGPKGLMEKEVVLDIARGLKNLFLESDDLKVFLTRESDLNVPIQQRARLANQNGGDVFLSLHTHFSQDPTESGFQIFISGQPVSKEDSIIQISENNPSNINSVDEIMDTLSHLDTTQSKFVKESKYLALIFQEELSRILPTKDKGISQADFFVLRKAYMPGIVIQIAHISSPYEELLLEDETFKKWVAQALYQAILRFRERSPGSL